MQLHELLSRTRELLRDNAEPYLWSDDILKDYINEAIVEFSRVTGAPVHTGVFTIPSGETQLELAALYTYSCSVAAHYDDVAQAYVLPDPVTEDTQVSIRYTPLPTPLRSATESPTTVPPVWQPALAYYAAEQALRSDDMEGRNDSMLPEMARRWREALSRYRIHRNRAVLGANGTFRAAPAYK